MKITVRQEDGMTIVSLSGRLDTVSAPIFEEHLMGLLGQNKKDIVIDFKEVDYLASAGMRGLLTVLKKAKEISSNVAIIHLAKSVRDLLAMTGFLLFLRVYETLDEAKKALSS